MIIYKIRVERMLGALIVALSFVMSISSQAQPRPNIVYFFADDLGWAGIKTNLAIAQSLGVDTTQGQKIITPNIDALVAGGINFTRSYGNPVCSPSRSAQQTGFHQGHTWSDQNDTDASKAMRQQDPTIGDLLAAAGYRNGMYGKWGYGASQNLNNPVINNEQTLPVKHGYHDCLVELHHVRAHTFLQPSFWYSFVDSNGVVVTDTTLVNNTNSYPELQNSNGTFYCDNLYARAAEDFIRAEANGPSPFFVQVSFQVPHTPYGDITNVDGWFDDYASVDTSGWTDAQKQYAAMLTLMDKRIGDILAVLRDPNGDSNQTDSVMANTLIVFGSDNGGENSSGASFFSNNGHLRDSKGAVYEGGIRVPLAFYWEGTIAPGQTSTRRVDVCDMLPTFCELASIEQPVGIDGTSFAPLLTGEGILRERPYLAYEDHNHAAVLWGLIKDDYKLIKRSNGSLELYNLITDEGESNDLAGDGAYTAVRDQMLAVAIAERLEEPDSFANVFPIWLGGDGADIGSPSNWMDNKGVWPFTNVWPYSGSPDASWNAILRNSTTTGQTATVSATLQTLGFEVAGNSSGGLQTLELASGVSLTGRNEIRVSPNAILHLSGGALVTERMVNLRTNAVLVGSGSVTGSVVNAGTVSVIASQGAVAPTYPVELALNGGFESGSDNTFSGTDAWFNYDTNETLTARNTTTPASGAYRGVLGINSNGIDKPSPAQDTGHTIALGEAYTFSFDYAGALRWDLGVDEFRASLYYLSNGVPVSLWSADFNPSVDFGSGYDSYSSTLPPVVEAQAVGRNLMLRFESLAQANEFASIDNVSLLIPGGFATNAPTRTLAVSGNYESLGIDCVLAVEIAGNTNAGSSYAWLKVDGTVQLGGRLAVNLAQGYGPLSGDTFQILTASGVTGTFSEPDDVVHSAGYHFLVSYSATNVSLKTLDSGTAPKGTPNWWLQIHGYTNSTYAAEELLDHDGDGQPTWAEYVAGTDAGDANSVLRLAITSIDGGGLCVLQWPSVAGRVYDVQLATNGVPSFQTLAVDLPATPPTNNYTNVIETDLSRWYRVKVRQLP